MKNTAILFICLSLSFVACGNKNSNENITTENNETEVTTYYLIRHAEKDRSDPNNQNPHLNEEGKQRAIQWSELLGEVDFDEVYSTDFYRTRETAQPLASKNNLSVKIYDANNLFDENFEKETRGKTVLVVGHSNTTPHFANAILGEEKYKDMDDANNGGLFIVTVKDGKATSEMKQY